MKISNHNKGMTIIEMLVTLAIVAVVMMAVSSFAVSIFKSNSYSMAATSGPFDASSILHIMVKELRTASQANDGSYALAQVATNTISFFSDINGDGLKEKIRYFLSGNTMKRGVIVPSGNPLVYNSAVETVSIMVNNVKNTTSTNIFDYYDDSYDGTTAALSQPITVTNVRLIKIVFLIDLDPNRSPIPTLFSSVVALRNLKDNL
jgi:prepilin-type N-terminal cleavage/methylation domain-containing protein